MWGGGKLPLPRTTNGAGGALEISLSCDVRCRLAPVGAPLRVRRTLKLTKSVTLPDRDTLSTHTPVSGVQRLARRSATDHNTRSREYSRHSRRGRESQRSGSRLGSEDRGPTRQAVARSTSLTCRTDLAGSGHTSVARLS